MPIEQTNVWAAISLLALPGVFLLMFLAFVGRCLLLGRWKADMQGKRRDDSPLIWSFFVDYWFWLIDPVVHLLVRHDLSPNLISIVSAVLSIGSGFAFGLGHFALGGWLLSFGGTLDLIDGRVARGACMATKSGAFFDSTLDRLGEAALMSGLAVYYRDSWVLYLVLSALSFSLLVSYARARGQGLGIDYSGGFMQRGERIFVLAIGTVAAPIVAHLWEPLAQKPFYHLTVAAIAALAVFGALTVFQRTLRTFNLLRERDGLLQVGRRGWSPYRHDPC
jgi:phosphatidylinositol phosphate synthase